MQSDPSKTWQKASGKLERLRAKTKTTPNHQYIIPITFPKNLSGDPVLRLSQSLELADCKSIGHSSASDDHDVSLMDCDTAPEKETSEPTPIDQGLHILEATDSEMLALNESTTLLRPNVNSALPDTQAHGATAPNVQSFQEVTSESTNPPELNNCLAFPDSKLNDIIDAKINQKLKTTLAPHVQNNQLVIEPVNYDKFSQTKIFEIEDRKLPRSARGTSLAHLKIGLHATAQGDPSWQYALVDSGCTDNLISLTALKHLADFNRAQITTMTGIKITTANNDSSQVVEGKVTLLMSLVDTKEKRICFRVTFLVVSGLTHEIFLGVPFLDSPQLNHRTRESLFFNPDDCVSINPPPIHSKTSPFLHEVELTHHLHHRTKTEKRTRIPGKTAMRVPINLVQLERRDPDLLYYFEPNINFQKKHPNLHLMQQTILDNDRPTLDVMVINISERDLVIKRNIHLGRILTAPKVDTIVESLNNYISAEQCSELETKDLSQLDSQKITDMHNSFEYVPLPDAHQSFCNHTFTSHMHEHPNSVSEQAEREHDFKNKGYFQKTVTEVLDESKNIPTMEYTGKAQFKPKTDEELLKEIELSHLTPEQRQLALEMLKRNIGAFQRHALDIGCCEGVTASAPLNTDNPPILYAKYVPIPLSYKAPAQKLIDEYCAAGVLAPTTKPCQFTSNIFLVPKKDKTFRLIFDGRILSKYCQQLPVALGNFDEIFSNLADKTFVSKLDLSQAYHQIKVDEKTSQMLSFFGPDAKRYVYKRSGQGLKFSSFYLNQAMEKILYGMKEAHAYCDDVFVTGDSTFESHLQKLEEVIVRFHTHNVKLNIAKLEIAPPTLDFLGLTWSKNKLSIPKSKITAYLNLKKPKSIKEARFLINSLSFYRRFIPKFSDTIHPVLELIKAHDKEKDKKKRRFKWETVHQNAVEKLVKQIENGMSLYLPRKNRMFIVQTDASYVAASATVTQTDDEGHTRLVAAVSRTFNRSERKLAPVHKEILALLYCLTSLNYILRGHPLRVFADAKSLTLLKTCSTSSPYLSRLAMELSVYDFELFHVPGKLNIEADALSRMTRTHDKILSTDKHRSTAMTKDESLLFLEYLTIPGDHHFTQSEVRQLLTSEPLRSELQAKVKSRVASSKRTKQNNLPTTVKSKKTKEPRYVRTHPLAKNDAQMRQTNNIETKNILQNANTTPTTDEIPSNDLKSTIDPLTSSSLSHFQSSFPSPSISQSIHPSPLSSVSKNSSTTPTSENSLHYSETVQSMSTIADNDIDSDSSDSLSESGSYASDNDLETLEIDLCDNPGCQIHFPKIAETNAVLASQVKRAAAIPANNETEVNILAALTDSDRHLTVSSASEKMSETLPDETNPECCSNQSCNIGIGTEVNEFSESLKSFDHNLIKVENTFTLNNAVGVNNVKLVESVADLQTKTDLLTTGTLSPSEFRSAQIVDPKIAALKESLHGKQSPIFTEKQGILCKKIDGKWLPILPESLEQFLFNCEHFHVTSGHRSADAIATDLKTKFFIFDMKRKISAFCKRCYICAISKSQKMRQTVQGVTLKPEMPKQIMSFDIFGGLPEDENGNKWVYTFIDNFSLFVINIRAKTKSTEEILAAFLQVFSIYSAIPEIVVSDNETALMSKEALDFFNSFGIRHNPGPANAHWRLLSEASAVKKSKDFMRAICRTDPAKKWPQALALGVIALNNTKTSYGYSPAEMFFGNTKKSKNLIENETHVTSLNEYVDLVSKNFNDMLMKVYAARENSAKKRQELVNRHRASKAFEVGQLVWLKAVANATTPLKAIKIQNSGPYKISRKINDCTFHLARLSNPEKCDRIAHASHLEPYRAAVDMTPINFPGIQWNLK